MGAVSIEIGHTRIPAAPAQVSSQGRDQQCPVCYGTFSALYGLMYEDRTLRCGQCHDDNFFRDCDPEARLEAERKQAKIFEWLLT